MLRPGAVSGPSIDQPRSSSSSRLPPPPLPPSVDPLCPALPESSPRSHKLRLVNFSEPDGNLYRGWAVGIENWNRNLFVLTVLVLLAQILGPLFSLIWARQELRKGTLYYVWNPEGNFVPEEDTIEKILGTVLLLIIFVNAENILKRRDLQADRLRQLYGDRLKITWMHLDAFCTSWCVTLVCLAIVPLLWLETDIKGVILDAFGMLFLTNLHEYSGGIEYGIEQSEFDTLIHEQSELPEEERLKVKWTREGVDGAWTRRAVDTEAAERVKHYHWYTDQFLYGDMYYSIGRLVIHCAFCFGVATYVCVNFKKSADGKKNPEWFANGVVHIYGLSIGALLFVSMLIWRAFFFCRDSSKKRDCISFVYRVLLERPDPRRIREALITPECDLRQMDLELTG